MTGLTRQAAEFIAELDPKSVPDACTAIAATGMTDCIAVMIAGAEEEAPRLVADLMNPATDPDGSPLLPSGRLCSAPEAALLNGVAAHALDYDDVGIDGHPSTVLAPAIMAEGWALGVSGQRALAAYVVGYEVWALMNDLEPGMLHDRGFHPTGVQGTIATAAASAFLHNLDADKAGHAIAIGASMAAGLVANFGTMTKPFHAGRTAQSGILAARLASKGFTGAPDILEHPTGYLLAHSPSGKPDLSDRDHGLGRTWRIAEMGINIKRYPLCYSTHRAIDAMLDIVEAHDLSPDQVREVRVGAGSTQLLMLRNHEPKTGLEAKFSMEFAIASALVARSVGLRELTDDFVRRPDVVDVMTRVRSTAIHDGIVGMPDSDPDTVQVELVNGTVLDCPPVAYARGSWQKPLDRDGLRLKFMDCVSAALPAARRDPLFDGLIGLASLDNIRDLPLTGFR